MKEVVRILNVVPNMRAAGVESFIMNVYRNIDREKVQFDFIVHNKEKKFFDDEIEKLGGRIYRFTYKDDKNLFKYIKDLNKFFREHKEYNIVHGHMQSMMPLYLLIARLNKVPIRIAHSHNGNYEKTMKGFVLHIFSKFSKYVSNKRWACSAVAGKYLFGKKEFDVIYNGIDINKFKYDEKSRFKIREELNIDDSTFVIGHIGRFELQKNHVFLVEIIKKIIEEKSIRKIKVWLIGEGKLQKDIEEKVKNYNLDANIEFLGIRKDISRLYQGMDCFVLPSLYEGLPVVGVESQISGLKCFFSNTITEEVKISDRASFIKLDENEWVKEIIEYSKKRNVQRDVEFENKFDIEEISKKIQERYIKYEYE